MRKMPVYRGFVQRFLREKRAERQGNIRAFRILKKIFENNFEKGIDKGMGACYNMRVARLRDASDAVLEDSEA